MEIKLDLNKKEIEVVGTVNLEKLIEKLMELNIPMSEWSLKTKTQYLGGLGLESAVLRPTPNIDKYWYNNKQ